MLTYTVVAWSPFYLILHEMYVFVINATCRLFRFFVITIIFNQLYLSKKLKWLKVKIFKNHCQVTITTIISLMKNMCISLLPTYGWTVIHSVFKLYALKCIAHKYYMECHSIKKFYLKTNISPLVNILCMTLAWDYFLTCKLNMFSTSKP